MFVQTEQTWDYTRFNVKPNTMRVLIIDNNESVTNMISEYLDSQGIVSITTNDPKEGLEQIRSESYDVVLLDVLMPGFNGTDIIQALENEKILKDQNIFIFSAMNSSYSVKDMLMKEGIKGCLNKTKPLKEILSAITC